MRRPTSLLQLKKGRKEGENRKEREKDGRKEKEGESEREGTAKEKERALESIRPETDLRNPSQSIDTQNWDSVIVSSVRCTLKRREFAKGNPRINFMLSFTSALDNSPYQPSSAGWPTLLCPCIGFHRRMLLMSLCLLLPLCPRISCLSYLDGL